MKINNRSLTLVFALSIIFNGISQEQQTSFSLEDVKLYALEHHLNVIKSVNELKISDQQRKETGGAGLPQINFNGTFNHFINLPVQVMDAQFFNPNALPGEVIAFNAGTKFNSSGTIEVTQMIFNGTYIVAQQASSFITSFQETRSEITREDVIFNAIQSYHFTSVAKLNLALADSIVIFTQELVDKQQNYFDIGLMLQEDLDQLNYSLLSAKTALVSAEINYENSLNMLKLSMGYPIDESIEITETPNELLNKTTLLSGDIHNNLNYMLSQTKAVISEFQLKSNRFTNLPSLNAFFQQGYNAYRTEFDFFADKKWYPQTVWGLQMNIPIFSGGQHHAKVKISAIELLIDQNNVKLLEQNLQFDEIRVKNNLIGAQAKLDLQSENVKLAKSIYANTQINESIGKGNSIIVTQKYNQLLISQAQYVQSLLELFQARLELDKIYNNVLPK